MLPKNSTIRTNSEERSKSNATPGAQVIRQGSSTTCHPNNVHNSEIGINKLIPDILYNIFLLAVYSSPSPRPRTTLVISHVCRHWRESALQWSILWAFVDPEYPPAITDLYVKRSRDAPLSLLWVMLPPYRAVSFNQARSQSYIVSHANSILSRLCSFNLLGTYSDFASLHQLIEDSEVPPLRLEDLSILLYKGVKNPQRKVVPPPFAHLIDNSYLRKIELEGLDLPWLEFPHKKLTHLTLSDPINPLALSNLLLLLSNCPLLESLHLSARDYDCFETKTPFTPMTPTSLQATNKLDFPNLSRLVLGHVGPSSYDYICRIALCIRTLGALSSFMLYYDLKYFRSFDAISSESRRSRMPFHILGAVPPDAFSHFSKYQSLSIGFGERSYDYDLEICAHTSVDDHYGFSECKLSDDQFAISCFGFGPSNDYSPILKLIDAMPRIRHLTVKFRAWNIFNLEEFDIRRAFPCLQTLALSECGAKALDSLPADLRVKRLILESCKVSFGVLEKVAVSTGAEFLELKRCRDVDGDSDVIISHLRERGVDVVWEEPDKSQSDVSESDESYEPEFVDQWSGPDESRSDGSESNELDELEIL